MAIASGVRIAFGTDAGGFPHCKNVGEFALLVEVGMRRANARRAGTPVSAELLGHSEHVEV